MWLIAFLVIMGVLFYHRASFKVWIVALIVYFLLLSQLSTLSAVSLSFLGIVGAAVILFLAATPLRAKWVTQAIFERYKKLMPTMSRTEIDALEAGTVTWEGDLFRGAPSWQKLLALPSLTLTAEEKTFLDGPVETLCSMIDDWDITQNRLDLPEAIWQYLKKEGFFAMNIPKEYGGKAFSAYAYSEVLTKIYGRSATVGTTVAVPNSLGPAELLLHYGTVEQKKYYLPRLALGEDVPCFALTAPNAGSDAGAMTDTGILCYGEYDNKKVLGIRLNFNKRYITLAPVATVIGLAFKLYDPDHLLGDNENIGITCALVPRETPGISIGRRHFPANTPFQNGPIQGKDVFIPVDFIIGGIEQAGQGWRMLMECLAAGRGISLPASAMGAAKVMAYGTGAYARLRRQFNISIGYFEGIQEVLARIGGNTYVMDATRRLTAALIDQGEKPALASAITKYHLTELGRSVVDDAMDIHAGRGICMGPRNYTIRTYEAIPIGITVEGANILTRCMIIFGQGVMRCHPYVYAEYDAVKKNDGVQFDKALMGHLGYVMSNLCRSIILNLISARCVRSPKSQLKRYYQHLTRFSSSFALLVDVCMAVYGGSLKRKETISARLGDILSYLYLASAVLKHFHDQGELLEDKPIAEWALQLHLYNIQQSFDEILNNMPQRFLGKILKILFFPYGKNYAKPKDKLGQHIAELLISPTPTRYRLAEGAFLTYLPTNVVSQLEDALIKVIAAEPIEKIIKTNLPDIAKKPLDEQAQIAFLKQIISKEQCDVILTAEKARQAMLEVDDFLPEELLRKA